MNTKTTLKILIGIFALGFIQYFLATLFYGAATIGGLIWELVGAIIIGGFGYSIYPKLKQNIEESEKNE